MNPTESICGYPITTKSKTECIGEIFSWIEKGTACRYLACVNPHSIEVASKDKLFDAALKEADLLVPDGIGVILASRISRGKLYKRITGSDIFAGLNAMLNITGKYTCFFLGSTKQNLHFIKEKMNREYPRIATVDTYSPPFKSEFTDKDNEAMISAINRVTPDVLWIGMTAPKQEKWVHKHKEQLDVKFVGAIGAVFDFYAGTKKRSNPWFQKHGLEWLPRLLCEPTRLWYRNFVSNPKFLLRILSQRISGKGV